ncbi:hypothetical protein SCHPADRAFT_996292 [Schizopora paradoxa]|uniref:Thioredoxin-like protein n=1 Tax=Schizopora paradoxa TaxID=27342 RepID=A0A0H2RSZ2_9AGAM|nr:hypothetical protein SCHPADRAFT_996292 [Schizopora paradoxa]
MSIFKSENVTEIACAMRLEDYVWKDQLAIVALYTRNGVASSNFAKLFVDLANATKNTFADLRFYAVEWMKLDQRDIAMFGVIVKDTDVVNFPQVIFYCKNERRKVVAGLDETMSQMKEIFKDFIPQAKNYNGIFQKYMKIEDGGHKPKFPMISQQARRSVNPSRKSETVVDTITLQAPVQT